MTEDSLQDNDLTGSPVPAPTPRLYTLEEARAFAGEVAGKVRAEERAKREALKAQSGPDLEAVRNIAAEEMKKFQAQMQAEAQQRAVRDFTDKVTDLYHRKIEEGQSKYPDFNEKLDKLGLDNFPHVTALLVGRDDAVELMREMSLNPYKLAAVNSFVNYSPDARDQKAAIARLNEISESIKTNNKARDVSHREPIGQVKASTAGVDSGDFDSMSISELRKMPFMRTQNRGMGKS